MVSMTPAHTYPQHTKALLVLGLPLVGSHLAQMAIAATDTLMLGRYSVDALAAITLAGGVWFVIFIVGSGFAMGVMPMVTQASEQNDDARIRRVTRMGLWLSALFAILFYPLSYWSNAILQAIGQNPEVAQNAQDYLRIAGIGIIPALLVMCLKSYLAALERTQIVLWVTVVAALANVGLNYTLIFGNFGAPELGIKGAAIASLVLQLLSLAILPRQSSIGRPRDRSAIGIDHFHGPSGNVTGCNGAGGTRFWACGCPWTAARGQYGHGGFADLFGFDHCCVLSHPRTFDRVVLGCE